MKAATGPGYKSLRRGRASIENAAYLITTCTSGQNPILADPANARAVMDGIRWLRDRDRIFVLGYVVMPDHVHLLMVLRGRHTLQTIIRVWKGFTARQIASRKGLSRPIWQPGYHDHMIRDDKDLQNCLDYLHDNPVRKGLVETPEACQFATANPELAEDVDACWMV